MPPIDFKSAANNSFQNVAAGISSGIGSSIGGAIGGLMTKWFNPSAYKAAMRTELTGAEREQNAFNARQAEISRQFDLDMFNRQVDLENSSFQRQVSDMKAAGVNPALIYGGTSASGAGTPSAGSGAQASAVVSPADVNALVQLQMVGAQMRNLNAQTGLVQAQAGKVKAETTGQDIQNQYSESYWLNQIGIMEQSRSKMLEETRLVRQKVSTEEYETAIKANEMDSTWFDSQIRMYESFMTKLDYQAKDEIIDLQMRCMRAAAAKDEAMVDVLNEQIGETVAHKMLALKQAGYFEQLGLKESAFAEFYGSDEGKETIKTTAQAEAKQAAVQGKYAHVAFWLNAVGGFFKDVGVGVGAAMAVKNFKMRLKPSDNLNVPSGMTETPVIMN